MRAPNQKDFHAPSLSNWGVMQFSTAGALTVTGGNTVTAGQSLSLKADSMQVPGSVTASNGSLTLNAVTGPINFNGSLNNITSTGGDIIIQLGTIASSPYPNDTAAAWTGSGVDIVLGSGSIFWGTAQSGCSSSCGIQVTGSGNVFSTPGHNISFDTKGVASGIVIGSNVTLSAN